LTTTITKDLEHQSVIIARYYDPFASSKALLASFNIAHELSKSGENLIK
jgi:hypothetical protein